MQQIKLVEELHCDREKFVKEQAKRDAEKEDMLQRIRRQCQVELENWDLSSEESSVINFRDLEFCLARNWVSETTAFERNESYSGVFKDGMGGLARWL